MLLPFWSNLVKQNLQNSVCESKADTEEEFQTTTVTIQRQINPEWSSVMILSRVDLGSIVVDQWMKPSAMTLVSLLMNHSPLPVQHTTPGPLGTLLNTHSKV